MTLDSDNPIAKAKDTTPVVEPDGKRIEKGARFSDVEKFLFAILLGIAQQTPLAFLTASAAYFQQIFTANMLFLFMIMAIFLPGAGALFLQLYVDKPLDRLVGKRVMLFIRVPLLAILLGVIVFPLAFPSSHSRGTVLSLCVLTGICSTAFLSWGVQAVAPAGAKLPPAVQLGTGIAAAGALLTIRYGLRFGPDANEVKVLQFFSIPLAVCASVGLIIGASILKNRFPPRPCNSSDEMEVEKGLKKKGTTVPDDEGRDRVDVEAPLTLPTPVSSSNATATVSGSSDQSPSPSAEREKNRKQADRQQTGGQEGDLERGLGPQAVEGKVSEDAGRFSRLGSSPSLLASVVSTAGGDRVDATAEEEKGEVINPAPEHVNTAPPQFELKGGIPADETKAAVSHQSTDVSDSVSKEPKTLDSETRVALKIIQFCAFLGRAVAFLSLPFLTFVGGAFCGQALIDAKLGGDFAGRLLAFFLPQRKWGRPVVMAGLSVILTGAVVLSAALFFNSFGFRFTPQSSMTMEQARAWQVPPNIIAADSALFTLAALNEGAAQVLVSLLVKQEDRPRAQRTLSICVYTGIASGLAGAATIILHLGLQKPKHY
eukprot:Cvel_5350.t1-p1 / transcript=Cvel_5350.t1 / gene=Cvel_5350 / organism=Chromera_velia_CCMP2878 / gene_product=hypothetical protein / transcript_product=hypothetical protein / location=Cvel_scaffold248:41880-45860(-) / protein_length=598 / sequence_SO=supercontig / SO=protein_coding / is_pseudo=false